MATMRLDDSNAGIRTAPKRGGRRRRRNPRSTVEILRFVPVTAAEKSLVKRHTKMLVGEQRENECARELGVCQIFRRPEFEREDVKEDRRWPAKHDVIGRSIFQARIRSAR